MAGDLGMTIDIRIAVPIDYTGEARPDINGDDLRQMAERVTAKMQDDFRESIPAACIRPLRGGFYNGEKCLVSFVNQHSIGGNGRV